MKRIYDVEVQLTDRTMIIADSLDEARQKAETWAKDLDRSNFAFVLLETLTITRAPMVDE